MTNAQAKLAVMKNLDELDIKDMNQLILRTTFSLESKSCSLKYAGMINNLADKFIKGTLLDIMNDSK